MFLCILMMQYDVAVLNEKFALSCATVISDDIWRTNDPKCFMKSWTGPGNIFVLYFFLLPKSQKCNRSHKKYDKQVMKSNYLVDSFAVVIQLHWLTGVSFTAWSWLSSFYFFSTRSNFIFNTSFLLVSPNCFVAYYYVAYVTPKHSLYVSH